MPGSRKDTVQVIDASLMRKPLALVEGAGEAHAILWPGNGARYRTVNIIELSGASRTIDLRHAHECVYYIARGGGAIRDLASDSVQELIEGSMIHIGPRDGYRLEAGAGGMRAIGGCVPVDPALYDLPAGKAAS